MYKYEILEKIMNFVELLQQYNMSYDNNGKIILENVYIITPYLSIDFFQEFFNHFTFTSLRLFVDKSSYQKAINIKEELIKDYRVKTKFHIIPTEDSEGRFVHAKMYYIETKANQKTRAYLVIGSSNASSNAFTFGIDEEDEYLYNYANAELNTVIKITDNNRKFMERYFDSINAGENLHNYSLNVYGDNSLIIHFPKLRKFIETKSDDCIEIFSFTNWVLQGVMYHKYDELQALGKIRIELEKRIKKSDNFIKNAKEYGFELEDDIFSISYQFIEESKNTHNSKDIIKSKYLFETSYGYWAPLEFKEVIDEQIYSNKNGIKYTRLEQIKNVNILSETEKIFNQFKSFVATLSTEQQKEYIAMENDQIDEIYYKKTIKNQLERQINKCNDINFKDRYISGYGMYYANLLAPCINEVVDDIIDYINIKFTDASQRNLLCKTIKKEIKEENIKVNLEYLDKNIKKLYKILLDEMNQENTDI